MRRREQMGGGAQKESWRSGDIPQIREVAESKTRGWESQWKERVQVLF